MIAYGCVKSRLSESREDAEETTSHIPKLNVVIGSFFCFQLQQLGFYRFLPDRECNGHKWNGCSASDSIGFILTRFYHSVPLIMTDYDTEHQEEAITIALCNPVRARMKPQGKLGARIKPQGYRCTC